MKRNQANHESERAMTKPETLPWARRAATTTSPQTQQKVIDLNDQQTRSDWLDWGLENGALQKAASVRDQQ